MIVYAYDKGEYITLEESLKRQPEGKRAIYVNLTNRCTCSCTFCLRSMKKMAEETTLWLKTEPTVAEVKGLTRRSRRGTTSAKSYSADSANRQNGWKI